MNARIRRKNSRACTMDKGGTLLALSCARNVYATVGRGTPEAAALLAWLKQSSSAFALTDAAVPGDAGMPARSRRVGVSVQDWRKLGTALDLAQASLRPVSPPRWTVGSKRSVPRWTSIRSPCAFLHYRSPTISISG
jgi:hypothetical protein